MIDRILKYWPILVIVLQGLFLWIGWSVRKGLATKEDFTKHEEATRRAIETLNGRLLNVENTLKHGPTDEEVEALKGRLTEVEAALKHSPTHDDLNRLHDRLEDMSKQLSKLVGEFGGANRTLDLLHQFLLEEGKRR